MSELVTAIPTGLTAFCATNLDDILILLLFFSQVNGSFRRRHIVAGQYLGFTTLVLASLPGFFGSLILPRPWIGLLGILPVVIGISRLLEQKTDDFEEEEAIKSASESSFFSFLSPQTYGVAAVTFANGGDNIGIYVPLFANSSWSSLLVIIGEFWLLVGIWCYAAYRLTKTKAIAELLTRYGNNLIPFVLIALGVLILLDSQTLSNPTLTVIALLASSFALMSLTKNDEQLCEITESTTQLDK
ncbi:cadmium resistance transporter [Stanieria cyanosphaera PCC 7437]|uniref:Cadmium resistance transporter n=1 Tax=Stanieria cyanosphaera (strain ATCC 29371 / PCC 7437) TaxID=111780 RepID=K9XSX7_STAC7|nr:cadmium resistance transporter [Stanieria cyanosphaera]AFZ35181.1 cadmium resistance transporter [Stanieria cyanosphaera PCC 7437]